MFLSKILFCFLNATELHFLKAKTKYSPQINNNCLFNTNPRFILIFVGINDAVFLFLTISRVFSLDSLDFCELASKELIIFRVSVSIRARPWLVSSRRILDNFCDIVFCLICSPYFLVNLLQSLRHLFVAQAHLYDPLATIGLAIKGDYLQQSCSYILRITR